jgi:hypothetical protein
VGPTISLDSVEIRILLLWESNPGFSVLIQSLLLTQLPWTVDEINGSFGGMIIGRGNRSARTKLPDYYSVHHKFHMT